MLLLPNFKQAVKKASSLEEIANILIECYDELLDCTQETKDTVDELVVEQANKIINKLNPKTKKKVVGFLV